MSMAQVMHFTIGNKRMKISIEEADDVQTIDAGTIVLVTCGTQIVNDTDDSEADEEDVSSYPAVLLSTHKGKCNVCWLLDTRGTDIKLTKTRWPAHWKEQNVFVLDTVHESVAQTSVTKHSNPESMIIATRCYNSTSRLVSKDTYSAVLVHKTAELKK
jgi:hypothetical protein